MIIFHCHRCDTKIEAEKSNFGMQVPCPACSVYLRVPILKGSFENKVDHEGNNAEMLRLQNIIEQKTTEINFLGSSKASSELELKSSIENLEQKLASNIEESDLKIQAYEKKIETLKEKIEEYKLSNVNYSETIETLKIRNNELEISMANNVKNDPVDVKVTDTPHIPDGVKSKFSTSNPGPKEGAKIDDEQVSSSSQIPNSPNQVVNTGKILSNPSNQSFNEPLEIESNKEHFTAKRKTTYSNHIKNIQVKFKEPKSVTSSQSTIDSAPKKSFNIKKLNVQNKATKFNTKQ